MEISAQSFKAIWHTQTVHDWLANSHRPRILHVFDPACNLINEHGEVISVVRPVIGNGPFNLVIEGEMAFPPHIRADSVVSIFDEQLMLGELTIDTKNAELWNPQPDWNGLHSIRDKILDSLLNVESVPRTDTTLQHPIYQSLISSLCSAIVNLSISSATSAAGELAGLGPGLTPAGDDGMLGAIYAAWIIHPAELAKPLVEGIAQVAAPRTTSLSAAWLKAAGRGEAGILWHRFFDELRTAPISELATLNRLRDAVDRILNVGETSGADAFSGFMETFISYRQKARI